MNAIKLKEILDAHKLWLEGKGGKRANLTRANLCGTDLRNADLCNANLCGTDLRNADLCNANLYGADLCNANLYGADLCNANLCNADLCNADLRGANLRGVNLRGADLRGVNLRGANLRSADLRSADLCGAGLDYSIWPLWCGGLHAKTDRRLMAQLAYHFCDQDCDDPDYIKARDAILWFANSFHRADECGELESRGEVGT